MNQDKPVRVENHTRGTKLPHRLGELIHKLLFFTHRGLTRTDFLCLAAEILLDFSGCDIVEIRIAENGKNYRCINWIGPEGGIHRDRHYPRSGEEGGPASASVPGPIPEAMLEAVLDGRFTAAAPFLTRAGSFWTGDSSRPILLRHKEGGRAADSHSVVIGGEFRSLALIPFPVGDRTRGVLHLSSRRLDFFTKSDIQFHEAVAETLGVALAHQAAQWALRERIKEITCLYGVAKATQDPGRSVDDLLREVVELLPPGWQYPDITCARITFDGRLFATAGFRDLPWRQSADVIVSGVRRGSIEVAYLEERPPADEGPFLREERNLINGVAETLGVTLAFQGAQWALRERVKELTCLYAIAALAQRPEIPLPRLLREIASLLPPAFQYPEITQARIVIDEESHATPGFREDGAALAGEIFIGEQYRGRVQVVYTDVCPQADEGPFLKEERSLIDEVAIQTGLILERRENEEEKNRLQEQLRHADRLATIGQLAAGAAHELNEPLGSVLGFAQLAKDCPGMPAQAEQDLDKIVNAALHAREVIKKLMIFSRQMPTRTAPCNLNNLVRDGLLFLESRCVREGISLVRRLQDDLPEIIADSSQLHQVLVNLVVNAIQAMPRGGTLTITTRAQGDHVQLEVEDTGIGMSAEVLKQLFIPFFTTKGIGQGTGLGLSVVHGIVTSHSGKIHVESQVGQGSRFLVTLPVSAASNPKENN
ncbi:MAG: hypothetical protein LAP85_18310 [Acidobacteriia bacterium]|nr:hypothetical protein [Terriglobia bacterium]